jgi:geranyl-CoA carboxylase beta subunit
MPVIASLVDTASPAFAANAARMAKRLAEVRALEQKVRDESASRRDKFEKRGQLLPRERVARLIDRGSAFRRVLHAGRARHARRRRRHVGARRRPPSSASATVAGKRCVVLASDSAIKGGTIPPMGLKKSLRAQEMARDNRLPLIYLVESGGANLLYQRRNLHRGRAQLRQPGPALRRRHSADRPWCMAPRPPAAPTCRACRTM